MVASLAVLATANSAPFLSSSSLGRNIRQLPLPLSWLQAPGPSQLPLQLSWLQALGPSQLPLPLSWLQALGPSEVHRRERSSRSEIPHLFRRTLPSALLCSMAATPLAGYCIDLRTDPSSISAPATLQCTLLRQHLFWF